MDEFKGSNEELTMSSKTIDDGGLAFPGTRYQQVGTVADHGFSDDDTPTYGDVQHPGMSLRDWLASQALVGLGTWMPVPTYGHPSLHSPETLKARAEIAYAQADAMIAARKAGA